MMQLKKYRKGPVGVLADLYLMEIEKIKFLMDRLHDEYFLLEINPNSESDFQSVRNIMTHVIRSGYSYANQIRKRFGENYFIPTISINHVGEVNELLDQMYRYTLEALENKWHLNDYELGDIIIKTGWGICDMEGLLEHAVMYIMRHHFQILKLEGRS